MKKYEPIKNDDVVISHYEDGTTSSHKWGSLKNDFIQKKITMPITKITLPRTRTNFFVTYKATKGFTYKVIV